MVGTVGVPFRFVQQRRARTLSKFASKNLPDQDLAFRNHPAGFVDSYERKQEEDLKDAYAWVVQLMMGHTEQDLEEFMTRVWKEHTGLTLGEIKIESDLGEHTLAKGIRGVVARILTGPYAHAWSA